MANFVDKKTVVTRKPQILVEPGLPPGEYVFEMTAITAEGVELAPLQIKVTIETSPLFIEKGVAGVLKKK